MSARPLVVTDDPDQLEELLRLAATAGVEVDVAVDAAMARRRWGPAPLVLVAASSAAGCARARLPRRTGVVLLGKDLDDAGVWQLAVEVGAEHVAFLPDGEEWLVTQLGDAAEGLVQECPVVGVVGGRGGAGATVLASALAVTSGRTGLRTLLVDADPLGGGIDLVLGGEAARGLRWSELGGTRGRVPAAALADALPQVDGLSVLSWDRTPARDGAGGQAVPAEAMSAVLSAGRRAHDLVVVDLPRSLDEACVVVLEAALVVLLVVPGEVRATAAASRVAASALAHCRDLRVVVRGPGPAGLDGSDVARALGLPLAGELRVEQGLELALERGEPPARRGRGPLAELCTALLADLLPGVLGSVREEPVRSRRRAA